jgi:hypothetical protein
MQKTLILALLAASVALPLVAADPQGACGSKGTPALGEVEIANPAQVLYIDDRNYVLGNGLWMYEESNGIYPGTGAANDLQRGGSSIFVPGDNEVCTDVGDWAPDTLIQ